MNRFTWTDRAQAELRQIGQQQALEILHALTRYGHTGAGDVKHVRGSTDLRLRVGDYRVRFEILESGTLRIRSRTKVLGRA